MVDRLVRVRMQRQQALDREPGLTLSRRPRNIGQASAPLLTFY
jgi:hypothetical protein